MSNSALNSFSSLFNASFFLYLSGFLLCGTIWACITASVVEKRGSDENWFWWGFFFGPFACAVASVTFRPETDFERVKTVLAYKELYDEGLITQEVFTEKLRMLDRKKRTDNRSKRGEKRR